MHIVSSLLSLIASKQGLKCNLRVIQALGQVRAHWQRVTEMLRKQFPTAVPVMQTARDDVLAFLHFPQEHWRKI
jgi:transposase-like protein